MDNQSERTIELPADFMWVKIKPVRAFLSNQSLSTKMGIKSNGGILNESHEFRVLFADNKNIIQADTIIKMDGEDYKNWDSDDSYVADCIIKSLPDVEIIKE